MGRKKEDIGKLVEVRERKVTFKKRRIGIVKKAIQLSKLTGAAIQLKIYNEEDGSLVEFFSDLKNDLKDITSESKEVSQFCRFDNSHDAIVQEIEEKVTKHGHPLQVI